MAHRAVSNRKQKLQKSLPFSLSSIVAKPLPVQPVPKNWPKSARVRKGARMLKSGQPYHAAMAAIRSALVKAGFGKRKIHTVVAFARNYFVEHGSLPSEQQLKEVFPYLKRHSFRYRLL